MKPLLFIGEKPSVTAHRRGWTLQDGRLAGRTLIEALAATGIALDRCSFMNLFGIEPKAPEKLTKAVRARAEVISAVAGHVRIVALGKKVSRALSELEIEHTQLRHPAARGAGRAKAIYEQHVRETLR